MTRARAGLVFALLAAATPAGATGPAFHTEPSAGARRYAVIVERMAREEGDFFGFVVDIDRFGGEERVRQRYYVQCETSDSARPGVWLAEGRSRQHIPIDTGQAPASGQRLAYNLWWAVCRNLLQRY